MTIFSDINDNNKVLPNDTSSDTGGLKMIYESKGGRKKKSKNTEEDKVNMRKQRKSIKIDSQVDMDKPLQRGGGGKGSGKKSKKSKRSKSKKSRSCKQKVINIYM